MEMERYSANSFLSSFFFFLIWIESCYVILVFRPDTVSIPWFWYGKSAYLIIYVIKGHQESGRYKGNPVRSDRFLRGSPRFQLVQTIDYITKLFHQDGIQRNALIVMVKIPEILNMKLQIIQLFFDIKQ